MTHLVVVGFPKPLAISVLYRAMVKPTLHALDDLSISI